MDRRCLKYLRGGTRSEGDRGIVDGKISGIENDEASIRDYVEVDGDGSGESAGGEIGIESEIVTLGDGEFGETRLTFELIHFS